MKRSIKTMAVLAAFTMIMTACNKTVVNETRKVVIGDDDMLQTYTEATDDVLTESETITEPEETEVKSDYFKYDPHVTSPIFDEVMGEDQVEAYNNLIDAVLSGERSFECADKDTYDWMMGQFPYLWCPILRDYIEAEGFSDGTGYFSLSISDEEFEKELDDFSLLVEDLMNEVFEENYTDFEKALSLYLYFSEPGNFYYDYDAADSPVYLNTNSIVKVLTTRYGICQDFATTYSFLLAQAGVDAGVCSGKRSLDGAFHRWSIVRLDGQCFFVDPTYAIDLDGVATYFMETTYQREFNDFYPEEDYVYINNYTIYGPEEYDTEEFACDDDRFNVLRGLRVTGFEPDDKLIDCIDCYGEECQVEYAGLE